MEIYENEKHLEQRLKYTYQSMPSAFFDKKVLLSTLTCLEYLML